MLCLGAPPKVQHLWTEFNGDPYIFLNGRTVTGSSSLSLILWMDGCMMVGLGCTYARAHIQAPYIHAWIFLMVVLFPLLVPTKFSPQISSKPTIIIMVITTIHSTCMGHGFNQRPPPSHILFETSFLFPSFLSFWYHLPFMEQHHHHQQWGMDEPIFTLNTQIGSFNVWNSNFINQTGEGKIQLQLDLNFGRQLLICMTSNHLLKSIFFLSLSLCVCSFQFFFCLLLLHCQISSISFAIYFLNKYENLYLPFLRLYIMDTSLSLSYLY